MGVSHGRNAPGLDRGLVEHERPLPTGRLACGILTSSEWVTIHNKREKEGRICKKVRQTLAQTSEIC